MQYKWPHRPSYLSKMRVALFDDCLFALPFHFHLGFELSPFRFHFHFYLFTLPHKHVKILVASHWEQGITSHHFHLPLKSLIVWKHPIKGGESVTNTDIYMPLKIREISAPLPYRTHGFNRNSAHWLQVNSIGYLLSPRIVVIVKKEAKFRAHDSIVEKEKVI